MKHTNVDNKKHLAILSVLSTEQIAPRIVWFAALFGGFIHDNADVILQSILVLCHA